MKVKNPKYAIAQRMRKDTRWIKEFVDVPLMTSRELPASAETDITLFDNQVQPYKDLKDISSGLLEATTSFGKTALIIALHQAWQKRSIVVVHTLTMVPQFIAEFEKFAGVTPTMYCNGKKEISDVMITTQASFRKMSKEWSGLFDNLFIDEADSFFSDKSIAAIHDFSCERKFGFTGTATTPYDQCNDFDFEFLGMFYGKMIKAKFDEDKNPLKAIYYNNYLNIYKEKTTNEYGESIDTVIRPADWIKYREVLDSDIDRKKKQIQYIQDFYKDGDSVLVLFDRVNDVEAFYESGLVRNMLVYKNTGVMSKAEREEQMNGFHKTGGILFGQYSILNRGYSNTNLNKVFLLYPVKGVNALRQTVGRVMRWMDDKEAFVYLWSDSSTAHQFKAQRSIFKQYFGIEPIYAYEEKNKRSIIHNEI